ncbi:restriction endonuclease subunit S [Xinfangfangia sp. D13-10-4-6]|uniref:restriction endonuclease subunit S n=1 Tax=Pseudogemmobacter hezensis TaxID=2737662 RepID=UPI00155527A3|nr:restriction endonuclease subunit S [Pseudogemmobacter hezensis]NPD17624.1 restriction endonuclease subunit S [Pseudogemmobacter hezensis]
MVQTIRVGDFLSRSEEWVETRPDERYKQITARLWGKGLTLRGEALGSEIAASRQIRARAGQFLLSRIDARHGAYGIVPAELDGALVSNDFPCFDIDATAILPGYFLWYSSTDAFIDLCRRSSEGSTNRVRLKEPAFLDMRIPLPPLAEQKGIVARLDRVAGLIRARIEAAAAMEADLQAMLARAFARCIDAAPRRPMAEVAPLIRRPVEIEPDGAYPELGVRSFGRGTFHKPVLPGSEVGTKKLFEIVPGDLLFNIVFAWEGAVAIAQPADTGRVGSHRFLACVPEPVTATADFLLFYFQTPEGLQRLGEASPGGAGRNRTLGLKKLETIEVPVPSLETQRWFDRLQAKVRQIRDIRAASARDADALIPALLHQVFGAGNRAA